MKDEQFKEIRIILWAIFTVLWVIFFAIKTSAEEPVDTVDIWRNYFIEWCDSTTPQPIGFFVDTIVTPHIRCVSDCCDRPGCGVMHYPVYDTTYTTAYDTTWIYPVVERNHIYYNSDSGTVYRGPYRGITGVGVRKWIEHNKPDSTATYTPSRRVQ